MCRAVKESECLLKVVTEVMIALYGSNFLTRMHVSPAIMKIL